MTRLFIFFAVAHCCNAELSSEAFESSVASINRALDAYSGREGTSSHRFGEILKTVTATKVTPGQVIVIGEVVKMIPPMYQALQEERDNDWRIQNASLAALAGCFKMAENNAFLQKYGDETQAKKKLHYECRKAEMNLQKTDTQVCGELWMYMARQALQDKCGVFPTKQGMKYMDRGDLDNWEGKVDQGHTFADEVRTEFLKQKSACDKVWGEYSQKRADCQTYQFELDNVFCEWANAVWGVYHEIERCWDTKVPHWKEQQYQLRNASINRVENGRIFDIVVCLLEHLMSNVEFDEEAACGQFATKEYPDLVLPQAYDPAKRQIDTTPVRVHPGNAKWESTYYIHAPFTYDEDWDMTPPNTQCVKPELEPILGCTVAGEGPYPGDKGYKGEGTGR